MKKIAETRILFNDAMKQKERFEKLYGPGDYATTIAKNKKHTMLLMIAFIMLLLLLVILQRSGSNLSNQGITLDNNGNIVSVARPVNGADAFVLDAEIISESGETLTQQGINLVISPQETAAQQKSAQKKASVVEQQDTTQQEVRKVTYQLNSDKAGRTVALPKELNDGTKIYWVPKKSHNEWIILFVLLIGSYVIYHNRDARLIKSEKEARESVLRELPEFVNKLVLLLNAGLIISNAFYKVISDHKKIKGGEDNYFYGQLTHILLKCSETNGSIQHEIRSFAVRTGVVEFMRLSNIISDSMTKGSDLMAQLKMEGDSLWAARRKQVEEKGKLAETKLTFPLVILLLVLLIITISPAMMEI